jgi:hypothetical protein
LVGRSVAVFCIPIPTASCSRARSTEQCPIIDAFATKAAVRAGTIGWPFGPKRPGEEGVAAAAPLPSICAARRSGCFQPAGQFADLAEDDACVGVDPITALLDNPRFGLTEALVISAAEAACWELASQAAAACNHELLGTLFRDRQDSAT